MLSAAALFVGAGCGGSVDLMNPTRLQGTLDEKDARFSDGSAAEFYVATARRNGRAQIEMESDTFDPYLIVSALNRAGEIENIIEDHNSGDGSNARVIFDVKAGERYFVAAVDDGAAISPGAYTITFSDIFTNARINPDSLAPLP
jgi:hypothetical protein